MKGREGIAREIQAPTRLEVAPQTHWIEKKDAVWSGDVFLE